MSQRYGKLLLILLIPALVYAGLKGFLYFKTKRTVDEMVSAAANQADIRYVDITTDLSGSVTVSGISVQPLGYEDTIGIDVVRITSDDPMFFFRSAQWKPGENAPPPSLSFLVSGISLPLTSDIVRAAADPTTADRPLCADGLQIDPQLLSKVGFAELKMDVDGSYRLDETARTLEFAMNIELHEIESVRMSAHLADVDVQALAQGAIPQVSLGGFSVALQVVPEFGHRAVKACAADSDQTVQAWTEQLALAAQQQFEQQGLVLGPGLSSALREFYRDWGEVRLVAKPAQPLGLLSLMFLSPEQLADALGLRLSLNDQPVVDTSFSWQQPNGQGLAALFGNEPPESREAAAKKPRRIIVRREYEPVAPTDIRRYVDRQVQIKPRGQPVREGVLKRISDGEAEVEQTVHGGKYTAYVPLREIESMSALVQREVNPQN